MSPVNTLPYSVKTIRWIARLWSILVFIVALLTIFTSDSHATEPVPVRDWFLLSLWGVAIFGLLVAWQWEVIGGIITIATLFIRELAWIILRGHWQVGFMLFWLLVGPPAILFLVAGELKRKTKKT